MGTLIKPKTPSIKKLGRDVWTYITPFGTSVFMSAPEARKYMERTGFPLRRVKR